MVSKNWRDIQRYGYWMREEAKKRIGHLYPQVEITKDLTVDRPDQKPYVGKTLTVIAWLWARTGKSLNPQFCDVDVPLVSSFGLSKKKEYEAYVQPVIEGSSYRFEVKVGTPPKEAKNRAKLARGAKFKCLITDCPMESHCCPGKIQLIKIPKSSGCLGEFLSGGFSSVFRVHENTSNRERFCINVLRIRSVISVRDNSM